jgi:hypothetical protein
MFEELPDQNVPAGICFGKQQNPGREAIDSVHHKRALSLPLHFLRKDRPGGRSVRTFDGHRGQAGGLVDGHHRVVFVEHHDFA